MVRFYNAPHSNSAQCANIVEQLNLRVMEKMKRMMVATIRSNQLTEIAGAKTTTTSTAAATFDDELLSMFSARPEPVAPVQVGDSRAEEEPQR